MDELCKRAISEYTNTLKGHFECVQTEKGCLLITPFLRSDNEYIEIELSEQPDGNIILTDNAETIAFLNVHGLNVNRSRDVRRALVTIKKRFNIEIENDEIYTLAQPDSIGESIDFLLNAIQDASYLIYKKVRRGPVSFYDEVEKYLIQNEIRYDPQFPIQGKAAIHTFRFHLNDRRRMLVEPLTATSPPAALDRAERLAFRWVDISFAHPEYHKTAVIDNTGKRESIWEGKPINTLEKYSDTLVLWSKKDQLLRAIAQ
jgi:hypothetical protein